MIFDDYDSLEAARTKIKVIGVGGAGKNAIDHMIENRVGGVEFIAVNTDAQDLKYSKAENRLLIGRNTTHGHGAGADPDVGRMAALESIDDIREMLENTDMVFITCGMGGGTGTGAAPVIAECAREKGCLTVGICTKPFLFEGPERMKNALGGLTALKEHVDTLIIIPNQRLLQISDPDTPMLEAYREADNVLRKGVQGIAEIISMPGMINVDFADVCHVMKDSGTALMGIGAATGPNRAVEAARKAIQSSLLEVTIAGATSAIVNFTASEGLRAEEIRLAIGEISNSCDTKINIIYGTAYNNELGDELVVTVVATGYDLKAKNDGYDDLANDIMNHVYGSDDSFFTSEDVEEPAESPVLGLKTDEIFSSNRSNIKKAEAKKAADVPPVKEKTKSKYPSWLKIKK